jgi:hypothetical protein
MFGFGMFKQFLVWWKGIEPAPQQTRTSEKNDSGAFRTQYSRFPIARFEGLGDPPAGHWKHCHPSTMKRFKAEMTCPNGHGLVLKSHAIKPDGIVFPSVVCQARGCTFHEFVLLRGWDKGELR